MSRRPLEGWPTLGVKATAMWKASAFGWMVCGPPEDCSIRENGLDAGLGKSRL